MRMTMPAAAFLALAFCALTAPLAAQGSGTPDFKALLAAVDGRTNFKSSDFSARLTMVSEDPSEGTETRSVRMFRRDRADTLLLLILKPENELGQGYLRVDDSLWFYDPESRKFTHSSVKENFQGTDAKNSDFGLSSLAEDYAVTAHAEGRLGAHETWILDLAARHDETAYSSKKIWITKKDGLLLKSEDYSLSGRLLRTAYYTSYARVGSSLVCDRFTYVDALVPGKKTSILMEEISLRPVPDEVFTKAYVERVNR